MATSVKDVSIPEWRLNEILDVANAWSLSNGVSIKAGAEGLEASKAVCAPYSLFPSVVPADILQQAKKSMVHFNLLMHKVALDHEFLEKSLKSVIEVDPFIKKLWNIYLNVRKVGLKQPMMLGLFRNDFMMNCLDSVSPGDLVTAERLELKQIEFNSIAASFGGLTEQIGHLHRLTLGMCGKNFTPDQLSDNKPATGLARGFIKAWELYGNPEAVIVFVISSSERNVMDQRWLEFKVYAENPKIRIIRKTLLEINEAGKLDKDSKLFIGSDEVAVLYLRDGYTDENYPTEKEWKAREKMELSSAIKCPSVQYQLMGSKKIQQELARPGTLEKFISDPEVVKLLRATFADLYSLEKGKEGDEAVKKALASPDKFVLKPQREGGGHNLYNKDITDFFTKNMQTNERNAYILMQRIFPWQQKNYLVKTGVPFQLSEVVSEIGVYGVYIGSAEKEETNYECGHMMRTKVSGTDEGGIVAGFAVLDTPFII